MTEELAGLRPIMIASDFHAWAVELESRSTNRRGEILVILTKFNVDLMNDVTEGARRCADHRCDVLRSEATGG